MRVRLTAKITALIILVLIIGFGVSTVLTIKRESELLVEQNKMAARQLIGTLVSSIETAMLSERPDITRGLIDDLRNSKLVQGLVVYRRNGVEAFTDLATLREVSKEAELPRGVMASIEKMRREPGRTMAGPLFTRALDTLQTQEALESREGATVFTVYQPIPNQERCQGCHGSDHKVRAVVQAATSMEPVMAEVRKQRNRQIMIGFMTIVAAAAVLAVAMRFVVVRPIHELAAVARRIGEGDFAVRARAASGDEVAELGSALNDMTGHLARAQQDLAARNTELATALENLQASRQRLEVLEQLKGELSKFVPDAVKELLERDPSATSLEKRNEEVSVLFLDIAGYTRLSEQLEAKRLNQLVQTYFSSFLEIIRRHHGDVNETAGDGLMVIFQRQRHGETGGGTGGDEDHALNATRAAFAIRQKTAALNEEYAGVFPVIALHMGINTGQALVGATKLGGAASQRWTFTATGPTTNIAARFAGLAEGGDIVVGQVTADRIAGLFVLEALGERTFKNVSQPLAVYRVIPPGVYSKVT
ncbi:MAG TPA: adenylate/guanylate cyclase domain-containing protein [Candidatus Deferrimicrobiaceae bacterium]|nr:adenylate/guanylate cyclase domain-containing protein [Candidatus Deferrimicrobiaceae bacterium]